MLSKRRRRGWRCAPFRVMHRGLVLGPQGAGKSLLVKKLKLLCGEKRDIVPERSDGTLPTLPTVGCTVEELKLGRRATCLLKEYGGCMAPVWNTGYSDCDFVVYVIDASSCTQISAATILLLEVLGQPELREKPFLLVFNKLDCHCIMSLNEYKSVMRLEDIVQHATQNIHVLEGSCAERGTALLGQVLDWIRHIAPP